MFVGSFYRVQHKVELDRIPVSSSTIIIYVEDEHKFYEKNRYGLFLDYNVEDGTSTLKKEKEVQVYGEEISDLETRLYDLEQSFKKLSEEVGGMSYAI